MGNQPSRTRGFNQHLYQVSSSRIEPLGRIRDANGRTFRYARAGASALAAGKLGVSPDIDAAHLNQSITAAQAIGTKILELTVTAGTAIAENALVGGQLQINDEDGEGTCYNIESNSALSATGTTINIALEDGLRVALTTDSEFTLVHSPWNGVVESATLGKACGIPLVAVPATYYYWAQTQGLAVALITGTPASGSLLQQCNATAGALEIYATGTITYRPVAEMFGCAGVAGEYKPVVLMIE